MNPQNYKIIRSEIVLPSLMNLTSYADGKQNPEPLKSTAKSESIPASILIERNVHEGQNPAELHRHEADLWICLEGSLTFKLGGRLLSPIIKTSSTGVKNELEIVGSGIEGGVEETITANDILYIPEGVPHSHWTNDGAARLWIIKIRAVTSIPLSNIEGL
jgi:mannose-6-phosphate isomerase-like protein (cupin superfamily)